MLDVPVSRPSGWEVAVENFGTHGVRTLPGWPLGQKPMGIDSAHDSARRPWVVMLAMAACIAVFLGLAAKNDYQSWETLSKFGYLPVTSIWDGAYWGLVTCVFVHFALWHIAFNLYWLWVLGGRLERAIGSLRFLGFFLVAAFVSSSFQLAVSDTTGIGASGVVYAIFGFMGLTRNRYPQFNEVLDERTIQIFIIWLVVCLVATRLKVWEVANAAHFFGLLFGVAVAGTFVVGRRPRLMAAGLAALVALAIVPLFWCPWSVAWLSHKAYKAHAAEQYAVAVDRYSDIIRIAPRNAWAYLNRSRAYGSLGQWEKAHADLQAARQIDPSIAE